MYKKRQRTEDGEMVKNKWEAETKQRLRRKRNPLTVFIESYFRKKKNSFVCSCVFCAMADFCKTTWKPVLSSDLEYKNISLLRFYYKVLYSSIGKFYSY